jgi:glycosyltransferase involved in cell wall biosynthesis
MLIQLEKENESSPYFCFVIIARNEEERIAACLESILQQHYDQKKIEIIVVDTHSSDRTVEVVKRFQEINPCMVRLSILKPPESDAGFVRSLARNLGAKECSHQECFLVFLDAHVVLPSPDWIKRLAVYVDKRRVVSGPVVPPPELGPLLRYFTPQGLKDVILAFIKANTKKGEIFYGGNFCIQRFLFEEVGGFPLVERSEDLSLLEKVKKMGAGLIAPMDIYVYHLDAKLLSYGTWLKRMFYEGFRSRRRKSIRTLQEGIRNRLIFVIHMLIVLLLFSTTLLGIFLTSMGYWVIKILRFVYENRISKIRFEFSFLFILLFLGSVQAFVINLGKIFGICQK